MNNRQEFDNLNKPPSRISDLLEEKPPFLIRYGISIILVLFVIVGLIIIALLPIAEDNNLRSLLYVIKHWSIIQ